MSRTFDQPASPMRTLSVSKMEAMLLCPRNAKYVYIDHIPTPRAGKLTAGNVVHEIIEHALRTYTRTGSYPDWKTLDDMYEPTWTRLFQEEEAKDWFVGWKWDSDDPPEKVKLEYRPLVRLVREEVLPTIKPWMIDGEPVIEWRIKLQLRSDVGPFLLQGDIDLLDASGVLMDWKTTDGDISPRQKRTWLQFGGYSLWAYPVVGEENLRCEKIFLIRGEKPRIERVPFTITRKHREYFVELAAQVWKMIQQNIFPPVTDTWLCKADFCSFYAGCQGELNEALHKVPQAAPIA